jgi:hypothetical protein
VRSSGHAIGAALAGLSLTAAGGCDLVFGIDDAAAPCGDESFDTARVTDVLPADMMSISWTGDRMVYSQDGRLYEQALPDGEPRLIDAAQYPPGAIALAPEGDALFVTAEVEPLLLQVVVRGSDASWALDGIVPVGTLAGSPSAAEFGPRRVLVRLRANLPEVQEYEADDNRWKPVGDPHAVPGVYAPNLTPSGLDMVYHDAEGDAPAVYVAHRTSTAAWFGAPAAILSGTHVFPQLLGRCRTLYTGDSMAGDLTRTVRRHDR